MCGCGRVPCGVEPLRAGSCTHPSDGAGPVQHNPALLQECARCESHVVPSFPALLEQCGITAQGKPFSYLCRRQLTCPNPFFSFFGAAWKTQVPWKCLDRAAIVPYLGQLLALAVAERPHLEGPALGFQEWASVMTELQSLVERLEKAVGRLEGMSHGPGTHGGSGDGPQKGVAEYVQAFDSLLAGAVAEYMKKSREIGSDVQTHAEMVHAGLMTERALLVTASQCQQPAANNFSSLLKPISEKIQVVQSFREKNRGSKLFNHLSTVSESIPALGWVAMAPKPGPYVKEMTDAAMFYSNRVLKEYKDVDKKHVDWVKAYLSIWTELQAYIKEYHTTGLTWSKTGPIATVVGSGSPAPATCGGPPPPPPGPPPPPAPAPTSSGSDDSMSRSALFAQINQGELITSGEAPPPPGVSRVDPPWLHPESSCQFPPPGLKHVSDDMKTHKNPALKSQGNPVRTGPKPFMAPKPACAANASSKLPPKKEPPVLELEGKKWRVENQEDAPNLVISDTELKQVAYVYKCTKSTLHIKGKINSITLDNCKKLGLVFDDVVGIVEIINSRDIQVQVIGKVPTISINKTDGCHIYLSKSSLDCEIVSAKSSEMNVLVPTDSGDFNEFPIPEQFKTVWNGQKLVTTVTEIAG
ncbi:hypothetical protein lerEdw1_004977 [Lerista edwardsae]|nr:hypothetical protein lerEdw1_004977 [Lerista edwardsae]